MIGQASLTELIARCAKSDGVHETVIPRLALIRASNPSAPLYAVHKPAVCIITQGRKQVMLGEEIYAYGPERYLVVSADVPVVAFVTEATPDAPYLCFRLDLDPGLLGDLVLDSDLGRTDEAPGRSLALEQVTPELIGAAGRLVALLDAPRDIPVLAPLAEREILYRLLLGSQAPRLRQIANPNSRLQGINRVIGWIRRHYQEPLRIEDMAHVARMSPSVLHQHFKAVTAMSPLQYQKQFRLQEARRLMLAQAMDAATASQSVGYESPTQFSREYSRLFGAPPKRDVSRMRAMQEAATHA